MEGDITNIIISQLEDHLISYDQYLTTRTHTSTHARRHTHECTHTLQHTKTVGIMDVERDIMLLYLYAL